MMQKPKKSGPDRESDLKGTKRQDKKIKFNLESSYLQCFISQKNQTKLKEKKLQLQASYDKNPKFKLSVKVKDEAQPPFKNRSISYLNIGSKMFNNKLLVMDYDQDQVYTDSTRSKNKPKSNTPSPKSEKNGQEGEEYDFVTPCVRVITQETDNTSNPVSARYNSHQQSPESFAFYNTTQREPMRNKRAVSAEESSLYCIFLDNIIKDGRTTIMLRNIPNKYTRDMILEEIDMFNFKKKYDFFYLPIDYRNQCNVGYAFINFIHTKFIKEFYEYFHMKKWQKFNSQKICQLCYARIQGTAQLINHFKDSNVLQQKDKKLRPMIDINYSNLASMIERQKNETVSNQ